ncbi:MAG: hypothetical protein M3Y87_05445 [Myxococcota bacterium]|nr:hypothetical protein [Myxococcota bacterium]
MSDLVPTHGARVLLELSTAGEHDVAYRVELHAPEASFAGAASLAIPGGAITFEPWTLLRGEGEPAPWMIDSARAFLRTLFKNAIEERDWPRKQLRWRERK